MSHKNNFIIGIGGSGGRSIAAFCRAARLRTEEMAALTARGARFEYLYIDSNILDTNAATVDRERQNEINAEAATEWFIGSEDVRLQPNQVLYIGMGEPNLEGAYQIPNIRQWIRGRDRMDPPLPGEAIVGAGQRRRYGRVLFAQSANIIARSIDEGMNRLAANNPTIAQEGVTFHLFATLGGGTGSGSIVDLVTLINKLHAEKTQVYPLSIQLYLYVGGDGAQNAIAGYFHANEYAALRDINALIVRRYRPYMAGVEAPAAGQEYYDGTPCNIQGVHLSSDAAELQMPFCSQIENMATSCLDMISSVLSNVNRDLARAVRGEDLLANIPAEVRRKIGDLMVNTSPDQNRLGERSYLFKAVSAKHLRHPHNEIATILKSLYAIQVYDRWLNGPKTNRETRHAGIRYSPTIFNVWEIAATYPEYKQMHDEYAKQCLADFTLACAKTAKEDGKYTEDMLGAITTNVGKKLRSIESDVDNHREAADRGKEDTDWSELARRTADYINNQLHAFVNLRRSWANAAAEAWGVKELKMFVDSFAAYLERKAQRLESEFARPGIADLGNMEERSEEWKKCGILSKAFGFRSDSLLMLHYQEAYAIVKRATCWHKSEIDCSVAKYLCPLVRSLSENLQLLIGAIDTELKEEKATIGVTFSILTYQDEPPPNGDVAEPQPVRSSHYVYDKTRLKRHMEYIQRMPDAEYNRKLAEIEPLWIRKFGVEGIVPYREAKWKELVEDLNGNVGECNFRRVSKSIHDNIARVYPIDMGAVMLSSIYEALANADANNCAAELTRVYLPVQIMPNRREYGGAGLAENRRTSPQKVVAVGWAPIPAGENNIPNQNCVENKRALEKSIQNNIVQGTVFETYPHEDPFEIRLLYMAYWMPARYASIVRSITDIYLGYLNNPHQGAAPAVIYYSNLDPEGECFTSEERPSLIPPDLYEVNEQGNP